MEKSDSRYSDLPLLLEDERRRLLEEWNTTTTAYPRDHCIQDLFEEQAQRRPEAIALVYEEQQLTYGELNRRANQLAHHLQQLGVQPEVLVGLCLERSLDLVVGLLAILKAGGAYLPLDPASPPERLSYILQEAQVELLLTQNSLAARLESLTVARVEMERWWAREAAFSEPGRAPVRLSSADNLAYVIYTSGSTGQPKGVQVTHQNVTRLFASTQARFRFDERDCWTLFHSVAFDFSVWELWGALLYGGRLVVVPFWQSRSPESFWDLLYSQQVTVLNQTASAFRQLLGSTTEAWEEQGEALRVRLIIFGGETLDLPSVQHWWERYGEQRTQLVNMYGITETTVHVTAVTLRRAEMHSGGPSPIGRPLEDLQVYVLDARGQPVPIGVSGELYVGGAGVARGYLRRPELTAQRFVPHPFSREAGARLYRTGDVGRYRADGHLEYLGRNDSQVKLRGFRIELGEIEAVLAQHPSVQSALVLLREEPWGEKRLVGYVQGWAGQDLKIGELRDYLRTRVPDYMVPAAWVPLASFPLTRNGKIDQRALPPPTTQTPQGEAPGARTPLEEIIAGIWGELLGRSRIGITEHFFELGGHSLLATQVLSRLRGLLQVELPLRALFEAPTIAALAREIEARRRARPQDPGPQVQAGQREPGAPLPLSSAQQRLWFLEQLTPGTPFYNVPEVWQLSGVLRMELLERSLHALVQRHEALRTHFTEARSHPVQLIAAQVPLLLPLIDIAGLPKEVRAQEAQRLKATQARHVFDLTTGPLLVSSVLRLATQEHELLITLHHLVTDGWSVELLQRELAEFYTAQVQRRAAALPPLPLQYADYALWQQRWLHSEALEPQLAYWREQLAGAPDMLVLPTDRPHPAVQHYQGATVLFKLSGELTRSLEQVSQREGVTLFMTLLAALAVVLARAGGQEELVLGTAIANRTRQELEGLMGFFVNTLALRLDLGGSPSFQKVLSHVREVALGAYAHQDLPFERLVEELQPERSLSHAPLCQVLFVLQNQPLVSVSLPDLQMRQLPTLETGTAKFDLSLEMLIADGELLGRLEYSQDLFDLTTIQRMVAWYQQVLTKVVVHPEESIARISLLTASERRLLLEEWNATTTAYPREHCIQDLFEEQAQRRPEAIALVHEGQHLTYGELNRRANQLAHYLGQLGVKPGALIGLCLDRSLDMVIGSLGILKAGAAYVPFDPAYPSERIAYMLQDAQVFALLTTSAHGPKSELHMSRSVRLVYLDHARERKLLAGQPTHTPNSRSEPEYLAYVIYTSGSTGKPKGVEVTHQGLCNLVGWHQQNFAVTAQDRATQLASIGFDAAVWELWPYLAAGAALCIAGDEVRSAPERLRDWLVEQAITISFQPTPLAESFLELDWSGSRPSLALRMLLTGGDRLHQAPPENFPCVLVNNYGPTENTVVTTSGAVSSLLESGEIPSIGRPIANTQIYVLDRSMQPVPISIEGELLIGGAGLARSYLRRPELTAERFIPDPFSKLPGARLYRTGDLVRYRPDGELDFRGRNDGQVKIRGFRIEPGEIEAILRQHSSIREAVVAAVEDTTGEQRLVAYVVSEPEMPFTLGQLHQYLRDRLPHYMIPASIMTLEQLPLSPNGKLDRRALPAIGADRPDLEVHYTPPRNAIEETLAAAWIDLLGIEQVGVEDNFFELGGHSLLATQVISRIKSSFQIDLPLYEVFDKPTVAELAQVIAAQQTAPPSAPRTRSAGSENVEHLLARLDQLSAEEIDALLSSRLSEQKEKN